MAISAATLWADWPLWTSTTPNVRKAPLAETVRHESWANHSSIKPLAQLFKTAVASCAALNIIVGFDRLINYCNFLFLFLKINLYYDRDQQNGWLLSNKKIERKKIQLVVSCMQLRFKKSCWITEMCTFHEFIITDYLNVNVNFVMGNVNLTER